MLKLRKYTIPGENLNRLRDLDFEISGEASSSTFSSASINLTATKFSVGVSSILFLLLDCEFDRSSEFPEATTELLASISAGFWISGFDFGGTMVAELAIGGLGFWGMEEVAFWGFWEFWVCRSKKCWMPNLEGWGWTFELDLRDDTVEEELGFFLGAIVPIVRQLQTWMGSTSKIFFFS